MKSHGARGRDGVIPSGDVRKHDMILVNADQPINSTDKRGKKQIQRGNCETALSQFGMQLYSNDFCKDRHNAQKVANPDLR